MGLNKKLNKTFRQAFSYNVAALEDYTEQNVLPLVTKSLFDSKTAEILPVKPGIKSAEVINIMDNSVIFQSGDTCGFSATGDTTFTQREIVVGKIKVNQEWCPDILEEKWTQFLLNAGSYYETLVPEAQLADFITSLIAEAMETAYWQSDTTIVGNENLDKFDGLIKIIDDSGAAIAATSQASITSSNVAAIHQDIIQKLPAALMGKNDVVIMEGWDTFRLLIENLLNNNNFHYNGVEGGPYASGELILPGTNIRVIAVHGLNGTNRIFAGRISNFYIGVDLLNDYEQFSIWYSKDFDLVRLKARWKAGTQVAFPNEIVEYTNT